MSINKVIIIGNLGSDPEVRYTTGGKDVATLSVATNRKWKDKEGNYQEEVEWHRVIVWGKSAQYCANYLCKGDQIYVEGRLQTRKWQDQSGNDRYTTEIVAQDLKGLVTSGTGQDGQGRQEQDEPGHGGGPSTGDDVPF